MLQKGVIRLRPENGRTRLVISGCNYDRDPMAVPMVMFLFTQIALNSAELVSVSTSGAEDWRKRVDPSNFLIRSRVMANVAGLIFGELVRDFAKYARVVIQAYNSTGSWLRAASAVCAAADFPDYRQAVDFGIARVKEYLTASRFGPFSPGDALQFLLTDSKKIMLRGLENLIQHEQANVFPVVNPGTVPFPKSIAFSRTGERHLVGLTLPGLEQTPVFVETAKQTLVYMQEDDRVMEGACAEKEVPCYPPLEDDEVAHAYAVWPCRDFKSCRKAWAEGRSGFCVNEGWRKRRDLKEVFDALRKKGLERAPDQAGPHQ